MTKTALLTSLQKKLKTPKKKWLRKWVKQLDEEVAAAEERKMARDDWKNPSAFIVKLMVGLVLIAFAAAIVIEVVALTS